MNDWKEQDKKMSKADHPLRVGILLRNRHDGPGGLEKVLETLAKGVKGREIELCFYGLYPVNYTDFTNDFSSLTYIKRPKIIDKLESLLPEKLFRIIQKSYVKKRGYALFEEMKADNLDALITMDLSKQFLQNYSFLKKIKDETNIKIISWIHISLTGSKATIAQQAANKSSIFDGHLAISEGLAEELKNDYKARNVQLVYNPIDKAELVKRTANKFIYVGRITKIKRVDSLIKQLSTLNGDWSLDIYGSTGNDLEDKKFITLIDELNLTEKVIFHGWQQDAWQNIDEAGILLLNSIREGFGLVIVEAMQRGIPVLAADCPVGPSELIVHEKNGWLYPVDDEAYICSHLQKVIDSEITLPEPDIVQESVSRFETQTYIDNFINQIKKIVD